MQRHSLARSILLYVFTLIGLLFALTPFIWMLSTALREPRTIFQRPISYLPPRWTLANFVNLLTQRTTTKYDFPMGFLRSMTVALASTLIALLLASLAGYALARFRFRGRQAFGVVMLSTQMMPAFLFLVPLFIILRAMHLINSLVGLTFTYLTFSLPFCIWMLRGSFEAIPIELEEAAAIDGCSRIQVLRLVVLPLAAPALLATGAFAFISAWNEFVFAFIIAGKTPLVTVQLYGMIGQYGVQYPQLMTGAVLVSIPPIVIFLILNRYLTSGLAAGAVKQ